MRFAEGNSVSEACQINDLDHGAEFRPDRAEVSEACQINDLDHNRAGATANDAVSEACQINDLDHSSALSSTMSGGFRSLSDQ